MKPTTRSAETTKKRKPNRDADTGKFEEACPFSMDELVKVAHAIRDIQPFLAELVLGLAQAGRDRDAKVYGMVGVGLTDLKNLVLTELRADPEAQKEAKKLLLEAERLGNVPLDEVRRSQKLAGQWLLSPDVTPSSLLTSSLRHAAAEHHAFLHAQHQAALSMKEPPKGLQ